MLWRIVGGGVTAAGVGLIILFIERVSRWIIDERRCKLAGAVVRALACDLPPGGTFDVAVDFNEYTETQYRTNTWALPNYAASAYRHPWLVVEGTLADGTR